MPWPDNGGVPASNPRPEKKYRGFEETERKMMKEEEETRKKEDQLKKKITEGEEMESLRKEKNRNKRERKK